MTPWFIWLILLVLCWPLALLALILWPLIWLLSLPFRLVGICPGRICLAAGPVFLPTEWVEAPEREQAPRGAGGGRLVRGAAAAVPVAGAAAKRPVGGAESSRTWAISVPAVSWLPGVSACAALMAPGSALSSAWLQ